MRFILAVISVAVFSAAVCAQTYGGQVVQSNNSDAIKGEYTGTGSARGLLGVATTTMSIGVQGDGGWMGVKGYCGTGHSSRYGLHGYAFGGNTSYGVYGKGDGAVNNYGGYFIGNTYCQYGVWSGSDEKLKKEVKTLEPVLEKLSRITAIRYKYDDRITEVYNNDERIGFTAQNLEEVFPECVKDVEVPSFDNAGKAVTDATGKQIVKTYKAVNYSDMIPVLLSAIQEQQKEIEELKSLIKK